MANLVGDVGVSVKAENELSKILRGSLTFNDMATFKSTLSSAIHKNMGSEIAATLIPGAKEIDKIMLTSEWYYDDVAEEA